MREPKIYGGGPIDAAGFHSTASWPHSLLDSITVGFIYCPRCAVQPLDTDDDIMIRNMRALADADLAVFLLEGITVGTPVEIDWKVAQDDADKVLIVHPAEPGLFVRQWAKDGATVVRSMMGVEPWLRQRLG